MSDAMAARYRDLHANPELSMQEHRTAGIVAAALRESGFEVAERVGVTGVVGLLLNGAGPTVLLRADMDALPVAEATGLPYASAARGVDPDGAEQPVMHACGHDAHVTCLLAACEVLAADRASWAGTVLAVFQPGEEVGAGARAMLDDGIFERFGRPDVCLGQHVSPLPAGHLALRSGPTMAASDSFRVRMFGRGGHGSMPNATVDPVLMAASTVVRLQGVVAREVAATDAAVVTIGSLHAGTKENIIPDEADLKVNIRSYEPDVRTRVLGAVERIISAEAQASGAPRPPEITTLHTFPVTVNEPAAAERVRAALAAEFGDDLVHEMPLVPGSEDFGAFGTRAEVPSVFWFYGGVDLTPEAMAAFARGRPSSDVPSNHSPLFAPVIDPTLATGARALLAAALEWLAPRGAR
ncbi:MAG: amidohydrolase [Jatrophihabitans sp.]|nr:MAG: amidohydrolase [Jatrophihabitans sp.]